MTPQVHEHARACYAVGGPEIRRARRAEPTDRDRAIALALLCGDHTSELGLADRIAEAIADERAAAQRPFLALADALHVEGGDDHVWSIERRIRAAAGAPPS